MKLMNGDGWSITLESTPDGKRHVVGINGQKVDDLKAHLAQRADKYVRWARHLLWRGVAGFIALSFIQSAGLGPWATTAFVIGLVFAGELSWKCDRLPVTRCGWCKRVSWSQTLFLLFPTLPLRLLVLRLGHGHGRRCRKRPADTAALGMYERGPA